MSSMPKAITAQVLRSDKVLISHGSTDIIAWSTARSKEPLSFISADKLKEALCQKNGARHRDKVEAVLNPENFVSVSFDLFGNRPNPTL